MCTVNSPPSAHSCGCPGVLVPSQPSEFKGEAKSETSILLSWVAPPQGGPDNQITGYELVYRRADDTQEVFQLGQLREGRLDDQK